MKRALGSQYDEGGAEGAQVGAEFEGHGGAGVVVRRVRFRSESLPVDPHGEGVVRGGAGKVRLSVAVEIPQETVRRGSPLSGMTNHRAGARHVSEADGAGSYRFFSGEKR